MTLGRGRASPAGSEVLRGTRVPPCWEVCRIRHGTSAINKTPRPYRRPTMLIKAITQTAPRSHAELRVHNTAWCWAIIIFESGFSLPGQPTASEADLGSFSFWWGKQNHKIQHRGQPKSRQPQPVHSFGSETQAPLPARKISDLGIGAKWFYSAAVRQIAIFSLLQRATV